MSPKEQTVLNDPVTAQYTHTLTVTTAGEYTCTVANNKPSSALSASTTVPGPPSPTAVTAVQDGPTSITVTWTPPSPLDGITGYTISYTGGGGNNETTVSGGNTMSHTLTGLTNGENYTISIVATTNGLSSAPVQATVGLVPSAPVLDSTPTVTTSTVTITGSVPSGSVVTGYVVQWQRDTSLVCPDLSDDGSIAVTSSSFTRRTITGLEPGNRYTITVTASNGAGSGPVSTAVTAMTEEAAPTGAPGPITLVTVTLNSATVQWGEVPCPQRNGEITNYTVTATKLGGMEEGTASVDADARQATISGLTRSTIYTVSVAAVNSAGTGPSTTLPVETPDGLTVSATGSSSTSLTVSWTLEDSLTATSYTISYSNTNNTDCFNDSRSDIPASGTSHTLDDLEEATEYSITVTATLTGNGGTQEGSTTATLLTA
ncbi:Tyrosine-protein phosphatase Lar-like, partial [Geodia barretti]